MLRCFFPMAFPAMAMAMLIAGGLRTSADAANVEITKADEKLIVQLDGKPFTEYLFQSGTKPVLWPVIGPTGKRMTREFPMAEAPPEKMEKTDHVHQRSIWFTHGDVNGLSFWHESGNPPTIKQTELVEAKGGPVGTIVTKNDWLAPDGKRVCADQRTLRFGGDEDTRWIDLDITITATDGDVKFGDTKEGTMGVRVAGTMKPDVKQGGKIINANGEIDKDAWGKSAPWVDYHGPVDGETVGIAMFNHPSSFRYPTHWHVRTYGLFAANPFGLRHFIGKNEGEHVVKDGESMTLRYRIYFHKGDEKEGKVAEAFEKYCEEVK